MSKAKYIDVIYRGKRYRIDLPMVATLNRRGHLVRAGSVYLVRSDPYIEVIGEPIEEVAHHG